MFRAACSHFESHVQDGSEKGYSMGNGICVDRSSSLKRESELRSARIGLVWLIEIANQGHGMDDPIAIGLHPVFPFLLLILFWPKM